MRKYNSTVFTWYVETVEIKMTVNNKIIKNEKLEKLDDLKS